ncbi:MAG: alpha/beta hydrolase [Pseudomonadota bacterium]
MSFAAKALNLFLRVTEKRTLARAEDIDALRQRFTTRARMYFHGPFGARYHWETRGGVPVQWALAKGVHHEDGPLILYFHGGGYVFGSTTTHRAMLARLSHYSGLPVCMVEYRLAPEHPFPAAMEDAIAAYMTIADRPVFLGGDSAGGGLAFALLGEILRLGLTRPFGTFGFSPFTDMTFSGPSLHENSEREVMLPAARVSEISQAYLKSVSPEDPRVSPLFADFTGATPVWLTAGSTEILRDDTTRLAQKIQEQGVDTKVIIEDDLPHVWPIFHNVLPEARATLKTLSRWLVAQTNLTDS